MQTGILICGDRRYRSKENRKSFWIAATSCRKHLLHFTLHSSSSRVPEQHLQSVCVCVCVCASTVWVCVCVGVINGRSWMASAGHDSTTARKSFLLPPWTADSELAGIFFLFFCWLLKSHHEGAVIITPNHSSTARASGGVAIRGEIKAAISDIGFLFVGGGCGSKCGSLLFLHTYHTSAACIYVCEIIIKVVSGGGWTFGPDLKEFSLQLKRSGKVCKCQH